MIFEDESVIKEAMAYDAFADQMVDHHYLEKGNYNRPLQNEDINKRLPNRDQVKEEVMDTTRDQMMTEEDKENKGPFSIIVENVISALDEMRKTAPKLYELVINQLVAEKQMRDVLPKEADFANFMIFFDSTFGFETWDEEQRKGSIEKVGFINYGVSELLEIIDSTPTEQAEKILGIIFSTGWKGITTGTHLSKVWYQDDDNKKEESSLARNLFDTKIAAAREFKRVKAETNDSH